MSNCCSPTETGQLEEVATPVESCCVPTANSQACDTTAAQTNLCPQCSQKGKKVDSITLKAMLDVNLTTLRDIPYLFCRTADCPVAYFAADGAQTFATDQLRVSVHQKELGDEMVFVCYCFRHSPSTIRAELLAAGQSTAVEEINQGIKADQCACEIRNPQGSCCLGIVRAVVKQIEQAMTVPA